MVARPITETGAAGGAGIGPCFTLVFAGDIGAIKGNPFHVETPFGPPVIVSRGDVVTEADVLRDLLDEAVELLEVGEEADTPGTDTYTLIASTKAMLAEIDAHAVAGTKVSSSPGSGGAARGTGAETPDHEFKSHPSVFWPAVRGTKLFEYRRDDRGGYHVGQLVRLRCWEPGVGYTDDPPLDRRITNVLYGGQFELPEGFCILGFAAPRQQRPD